MVAGEGDTGAVPLVRLAELDSATHHLREQTNLDRRQQAARNRDVFLQLDALREAGNAIRLDVSRVSDTCARLERGLSASTETQGKIMEYISEQKGSLRILTWLVVAIGLPVVGYAAKLFLAH